ncbi:cbb3-type cytochrome oxidase assembly protein CcoS [Pedobacter sp. Du54]|uniref:cbb3-type cytochrome oxidase assembly protein CcoS n=1 Tax=Pedobacter anseongensis TaxID=3133439 RepID=UPI0030960489
MIILYFLIGCSIVMALIFLAAFFWSLKNGQHDDMVTPGIRILFDDEVSQNTEDPKVGKTGLSD